MSNSYVVSGSPPTPNGDLHLGHLSGPYSGADVFARSRRLLGAEALYIVGSDLHQSYVPMRAIGSGATPDAVAQHFDDEIRSLFRAMRFSNAVYVTPRTSPRHHEMVSDFVRQLHQLGRLEVRREDCLHCPQCDRYLFEAYVTGTCPHCGDDDCDGNLCEVCARPNAVHDLVEPRCNRCGKEPVLQPVERLVFPLSRYADRLREFHARTVMSPQIEALTEDLLAAGLPDIPISHPAEWGIPVPIPGFGGQKVYVWAEMVPGYFAEVAEALDVAGRPARDWRQVWNGSDVVQFFGWDNCYFHALLHPALMMAYDPSLRLPSGLMTNEFYLLDAAKFSTSRRHAVWGSRLLSAVPSDVVRFALALDRPQFARTSFTFERFRGLVDGELVGVWQPWLTSLFERFKAAGGRVPDLVGGSSERFVEGLATLAVDGRAAYELGQFSPRRAARTLVELVARTRDLAAGHSRHARDGHGGLAAEAAAAALLARLAAPVMPEFAGRLWTALGFAGEPSWGPVGPVPVGQRVRAPKEPFFSPLPADIEFRVAEQRNAG